MKYFLSFEHLNSLDKTRFKAFCIFADSSDIFYAWKLELSFFMVEIFKFPTVKSPECEFERMLLTKEKCGFWAEIPRIPSSNETDRLRFCGCCSYHGYSKKDWKAYQRFWFFRENLRWLKRRQWLSSNFFPALHWKTGLKAAAAMPSEVCHGIFSVFFVQKRITFSIEKNYGHKCGSNTELVIWLTTENCLKLQM